MFAAPRTEVSCASVLGPRFAGQAVPSSFDSVDTAENSHYVKFNLGGTLFGLASITLGEYCCR
jgi:hypothetical protein